MKRTGKENIIYVSPNETQYNLELMTVMVWLVIAAIYIAGVQALVMNLVSATRRDYVIMGLVLLCILVFSYTYLRYFSSKKQYLARIYLAAGVVIALLSGGKVIVDGPVSIANAAIGWWNIKHQDGIVPIGQSQIDKTMVMQFLILCTLFLLAVFYMVRHKRRGILSSICTVVLCVGALLLGHIAWMGIVLLFLGQWGAYMYHISRRIHLREVAWFGVLAALLCVLAAAYRDETSQISKYVRDSAKQGVEDTRYGKSTLPEGDLYKSNTMLSSDKKVLKVHSEQVKDLYLYGFVGANYNNGKWTPLTKAAFGNKNHGMLDWFDEQNFSLNKIYSQYNKNLAKPQKENRIKVQNIGADREYVYAPITAGNVKGTGCREERDEGFVSHAIRGCSSYQVAESSDEMPGEMLVAANWVQNPKKESQKKYLQSEEVYRRFVYENYKTVNDEVKFYINRYFVLPATKDDRTGVYAVTRYIRKVLKTQAEYVENPGETPEEYDPIYYFLVKQKKGNSALFAATAVEAFRSFGIPARYVEGYLLKKEKVEASGNRAVTMTAKDAHAWVQVYMDAVGWVDIDVTPGFYYEEYALMQMVENPQGIQLTAELEDDKTNSSPLLPGGSKKKKKQQKDGNFVVIVLQSAVIHTLILALLAILVMEIYRLFRLHLAYAKLENRSEERPAGELYHLIVRRLHSIGIEARLGWQIEETQMRIRYRCSEVYDGEYAFVNALIEKEMYGGIELKSWELRAIEDFLDKLYFHTAHRGNVLERLRMRYFV